MEASDQLPHCESYQVWVTVHHRRFGASLSFSKPGFSRDHFI